MSQSSSQSACSSQGGGGVGYDGQGSPVPYRVGPLAYEPAVQCGCKMKACRWISWSNGHPGRRYYRCKRARTRQDYSFFNWVDEECSAWYKEVIRDLRDAVWKLKKEVAKKEEEKEAKQMELELMKKDAEEKKVEVEVKQHELHAKHEELTAKQLELNCKKHELTAKEVQGEALEAKLKIKNQHFDALVVLCVLLLMILVVVLLIGKKA